MSETRTLRTSTIARELGVHPNTVRLYESLGYLPAVPRNPRNGYREFTERHLLHMQLACTALNVRWWHPAKPIVVKVVLHAAAHEFDEAFERLSAYQSTLDHEIAQAELAAEYLERWARVVSGGTQEAGDDGPGPGSDDAPGAHDENLLIGQAARLLEVSTDVLRGWEANRLLRVPRDPGNGYRRFGADEIGRARVVRLLRSAGYSPMAVLRMMTAFESGTCTGLGEILDAPAEDEEVCTAADAWLTALATLRERSREVHRLLSRIAERARSARGSPSA